MGRARRGRATGDVTKRLASKYKINRALSENLWGRPKSPVNRREYRPGQHGQARRRRQSDFGVQLQAKQKLKSYYGEITERQFRRLYDAAVRRRGDTSEHLIGLLERRLASVVYRMKFAPTVFAARQIVSHGHVTVNGKRVDIPSYLVSAHDTVAVQAPMKDNALVLAALESPERETPDYLEVDPATVTGKFLRVPALADVPYPVHMEPQLVIEFYSR